MMGRQGGDERQLFYLFNLEDRIPTDHLLRRINPIRRLRTAVPSRARACTREKSLKNFGLVPLRCPHVQRCRALRVIGGMVTLTRL